MAKAVEEIAAEGADIVAAALGLETPVPAPGTPLDDDTARRVIEAVLTVADEPIPPRALGDAIGRSPPETERLCDELAADLAAEQRGFVISRVAGGYRFQTNPDFSSHVEQFLLSGQSGRLSAAALETLAVVAYRQPVSRTQIAAIRGVNVDGVMRTLEQRGLVAEVARDHWPRPSRALWHHEAVLGTLGHRFGGRVGPARPVRPRQRDRRSSGGIAVRCFYMRASRRMVLNRSSEENRDRTPRASSPAASSGQCRLRKPPSL